MGKYFSCAKCGHDTFSDKGIFSFALSEFQGLKCLKCGNQSFLEMKSSKFKQISIRFEEKSEQKLLKK